MLESQVNRLKLPPYKRCYSVSHKRDLCKHLHSSLPEYQVLFFSGFRNPSSSAWSKCRRHLCVGPDLAVVKGSSDNKSLSNNTAKKAEKQKKREEEMRQKEEKKALESAAAPAKVQKPRAADDEDMDPTQCFENRRKALVEKMTAGINPYPHKFEVSSSMSKYIDRYRSLNDREHREDVVSLAGHIMHKRSSSSKLFFYDLHDSGVKIQVMADARTSELDETEFSRYHSAVKRGDIVGVTGFPGKSKRGELSVFPRSCEVLSHCLHMMPSQKAGPASEDIWTPGRARNPDSYVLKDQEIRYRERHLDLLLNPDVRKIFQTREAIISHIRQVLKNLDFLEVETPMMNTIPGGAAARPFVTHHNGLNRKMFMRIAPELYLKQLVVGGLNRVFEIGKQFRNEGIDLTHNPEFTTCEFYMAYADYYDLMKLTEEMLSGMVKDLTGGYKVQYHANGLTEDPIEIDFTPPFRRIDMIEELEKIANLNIPKDYSSKEANAYLDEACTKLDVKCPPPRTTTRLLDKLVGHFLEGTCVNPTFIMNHPEIMSPLAKGHRSKPGLAERFELFVNKHELCNAYTELNNPIIQRQRFADQLKDRQCGDDEAMVIDEHYCEVLEYGLPPTAGWGLGIDRLAMILTDSQNIKEVVLFPAMRLPQDEQPPDKGSTGVGGLRKKVKDLMGDFQEFRRKTVDEYKEAVAQRYLTITGERADEETVENLIASGESKTYLQQQKAAGIQEDAAAMTDIQERHDAVKEIEKMLAAALVESRPRAHAL